MEIINTFVFPIVQRCWIVPALKSLYEHTAPDFQVIVVDQTQPDRRFEEELREYCDLHIKSCKYNLGFGQAVNQGLRIAATKYVTAANDDVLFLPHPYKNGWFQGILDTFERFPTASAVNPMSLVEPGWGWDEKEDRKYLSLEEANDPQRIGALIEKRNWQVIDGIVMFMTTFKKAVLEEIGYFDERFRQGSGEDYDFCARGAQAGYRQLATSRCFIWHWWGQSKDRKDMASVALPNYLPNWNKLSTKGFGSEGLWSPDVCVWGRDCTRTDPTVARMNLR